ncbi:hypothetical protein [Conexibacter sp. SYSU D00693]|uniref:hypothetical protein n=1 Tax=Conexibacter sp. SYSU D00693 TaxID=2812560 RepID=UPI00196B818C|nr:hypothetical protein [Conexibacter sp. SYSU D00693]
MTARHVLPATLLLAGAGAAALPAAASAQATVATDRPCYVEQQPMAISGTGFTPGARLSVETEQLFSAGNADAGGGFVTTTETAPIVPTITPDKKTFTLVAKQDGVPVAQTQFQVANFAYSVTPSRARPTSKVRYRFSGWPTGRNVYVHVRRNGRTLGTTKLGKTQGACGELSKRARFMPVRRGRVPFGTYRYQFDLTPKYSSKTVPRMTGQVSIVRTFR